MKNQITRAKYPVRSKDLPATQGMLYAVRDELKSDITSVALELRALIKTLDARFDQMDRKFEARFNQMDAKFEARFNQMDAKFEARFDQMDSKFDVRFDKVDSRFEKMQAELHKQTALMEEQNAKSNYVLDGYQQIYDRQDRVEKKLSRVEQNG